MLVKMRIGKRKSNDFLKEYVRTKTGQKNYTTVGWHLQCQAETSHFKSAKLMNKIIRKLIISKGKFKKMI